MSFRCFHKSNARSSFLIFMSGYFKHKHLVDGLKNEITPFFTIDKKSILTAQNKQKTVILLKDFISPLTYKKTHITTKAFTQKQMSIFTIDYGRLNWAVNFMGGIWQLQKQDRSGASNVLHHSFHSYTLRTDLSSFYQEGFQQRERLLKLSLGTHRILDSEIW